VPWSEGILRKDGNWRWGARQCFVPRAREGDGPNTLWRGMGGVGVWVGVARACGVTMEEGRPGT
jgi:hypothetical protein